MRVKPTLYALTIAALVMMPGRAAATVVVGADLGELFRDARAIAVGQVVAVDGRWTDDRRTIETIVTLSVDHYLKGSLGSTVQFRVAGGRLGRYRSVVVGAPNFAVDQQVVVFLGATGPMIPYVLGFNQGVYRIIASDDGRAIVTPPAMLPTASVSTPLVRGDASRKPMPLADFETRVRALGGAR
jgi:hypothetical protein